jgi:hypothetical protein
VATLRERNGVYFIDYRVNGRRLRKCVGKSKKIADLALKDIELQIAKGEIGLTPKDQNLNTLFQEFLNYCHTNLSPNSQKRYKAIINHFETFLGQYPYLAKISHLSPKTLEDYKAFRKRKPPTKPSTLNCRRLKVCSIWPLNGATPKKTPPGELNPSKKITIRNLAS